jgi:hypothetical protein
VDSYSKLILVRYSRFVIKIIDKSLLLKIFKSSFFDSDTFLVKKSQPILSNILSVKNQKRKEFCFKAFIKENLIKYKMEIV